MEHLIPIATTLVRESAYNVVRTLAEHGPDMSYSRAMNLYVEACKMLRAVDPLHCNEFIQSTYQPHKPI